MQFIRKGPDIPERLLQLHEDGCVVFFCGAGISYPASLPGFGPLVTKLYTALSITPNPVQQAAIKAGQFDTAIGLLEAGVVGQRETVRRAMTGILTPDLTRPKATATHEALLTLGQNREGRMRLVTTNFDRLFEYVIAAQARQVSTYQAPLLPVPKTRWDGLVYLHGLLSETPTPKELDQLVLSSGDFGLAYLNERWASRFISELFRGYTICFVGYSINDPVLRYMMDALAADRLLGESPPEMFAFGSYSKGREEQRANEWKAKNVTPILYREHHNHTYLHKTLHAWAETYRDGVRGKERIVAECAIARPLASTVQDNFVGRMLWAISHAGGLPAKHFANLNPVPSLDWLEPFSENLYAHADLNRFGVPALSEVDKKLTFSLMLRPTPYTKAQWMALVRNGNYYNHWDEVMYQLAQWLTRHINEPELLLWMVKRGGQLHYELARLIEDHLEKIFILERDGNSEELGRILENSPQAIPTPPMRTLWKLLLSGRIKTRTSSTDLYRWRQNFNQDGISATSRIALREALRPVISIREAFRWPDTLKENDSSQKIKNIVDWDIELASHHTHSALRNMPNNEQWIAALPKLLNDFNILLHDALDLMNELGEATIHHDYSYIHQPSISEHPQNKNHHDWTILIVLTRDAWLATANQLPEQARLMAESWIHAPYPAFKRLAFFAATQQNIIPTRTALDFLLKDNHWWLWSIETQREAMRLLLALASRIDETELKELEQAIFLGPPRNMFAKEIDVEFKNHMQHLRLSKLIQGGAALSIESNELLNRNSSNLQAEQVEDGEQNEFPIWIGGGWTGDRDPWKKFTSIPRTRRGVLNYIFAHPTLDASEQDDWKELCSTHFQAAAYSLCRLAEKNDSWPTARWRDAIQSWSDEKLRKRSWHYAAPLLQKMPDELLRKITHDISWWLQSVAKSVNEHENYFLEIISRILQLDFEQPDDADTSDDLVFSAINSPIGHVTQALLDWWYRQELEDGQGLPDVLKINFSEMCDPRKSKFKHSRIILAAHTITLFRVDSAWAVQYLLPLFNWRTSTNEARAAWEGYLWSPRLYRPLLEVIKPAFLETANHYSELGKHRGQYISLLTLAALEPGDTFINQEIVQAVHALPSEGLHKITHSISHTLESMGEQRENYWKNRVEPFWKKIWPRSNDRELDANAESIALLCIAAGDEFPSAVKLIGNWLQPVEQPDYVIHRLHESKLHIKFPESTLQLLDSILSNQSRWLPPELRNCLDVMTQQDLHLQQDRKYIKLDELARKHGL